MIDGMVKDGLWDVYNDFHMGSAAELCAKENNISRVDQDEFAELSYRRALEAQKNGLFQEEIVPVEIPQRRGDPLIIDTDEEPTKVNFDKMKTFAVVSIINNQLLNLDINRVNVNGGSIALGHPIGASGARILTTLLHTMQTRDLKRGIASLCIGGGEASSLLVETI